MKSVIRVFYKQVTHALSDVQDKKKILLQGFNLYIIINQFFHILQYNPSLI